MHVFQGTTANEVWVRAAERLAQLTTSNTQSSRGGDTVELLHVGMSISRPTDRWVLSRWPALNPAFALAEVVWILNGRQDSEFLNFWNPALPRFQGTGQVYYGAYGFRLKKHFGPDQIWHAYRALRENPDSRQVTLQIWDPRLDLPEIDGRPRAPDIPCNICSLLKVRQGSLEWVQVMRSNDIFLGLPHNLVQFTFLHEIMSSWLGLNQGAYTHFSDSLHVYQENLEQLRKIDLEVQIKPNTDKWDLDYKKSQQILSQMSSQMDVMRSKELTRQQLIDASKVEGSETAQNMLKIVAADAARRNCFTDLVEDLVQSCSNPVLVQGWQRWFERYGHNS